MKRRFALGLLAPAILTMAAALLGGCPIYNDDENCHRDNTCTDSIYCGSARYSCPAGYYCGSNGYCSPDEQPRPPITYCSTPAQCTSGSNCGSDNQCHTGDCSVSGCPGGYNCVLQNQKLSCVAATDGGAFSGCHNDTECTSLGAGSKCLSGVCTKPADQCTDGTQCKVGQCVQGVCTPSCDGTKTCPTGYSCDTAKGVCTGNPSPCGTGATGTCAGGNTCVQDHCVPKCGPGNTCGTGLVCVDGGCMPDQRPVFTCDKEGTQDRCAIGSTCLHHSCYIACSNEGGATCAGADKFNVCKDVSTSSGTYSVCGSNSNLGTDCDPSQGKNCTSPQICIDGFCR